MDTITNTSGNESSISSAFAYVANSTPQVLLFGWILDGGATAHICKTCSAFKSFTPE